MVLSGMVEIYHFDVPGGTALVSLLSPGQRNAPLTRVRGIFHLGRVENLDRSPLHFYS